MLVTSRVDGRNDIESHLAALELATNKLASRTTKPFAILDADKIRGFRYGKPNIVHYVIIASANSVAGLHAALLMLGNGFQAQCMIICRHVFEINSKLLYVINGLRTGTIDKKSERFLEDFFADNVRDDKVRQPYRPISQKDIHRRNSESVTADIASLKSFGLAKDKTNENDEAAKIQSLLYREFSNFVHGRYPEMMTIFGEKSFAPQMNGNFESKDIDTPLEYGFISEVVRSTSSAIKVSLMRLEYAGFISLSDDERKFVLDDVF